MIYVTGDTHGDYDSLIKRGVNKLKKGDKLIITGDFGFIWDGSEKEQKNLSKLSKKKFDILFVEGAHENRELLEKYAEADLYLGKAIKIAHNIYCLKRGEIYKIDGKTVLAIGGGMPPMSDDPADTGSTPTDDELRYAVDNIQALGRKVDLIITHEAPASVKKLIDRTAQINDLNIFLDTVMHNTRYGHWYFGNLHSDRDISDKLTCVFEELYKI